LHQVDERQVEDYLARIGAQRPPRADAAALRELSHRHLLAVPFENLSIPPSASRSSSTRTRCSTRLVRRRRGGFCYELNGAFAALLAALGFEVTLLAARVFGDGGIGPPLAHLALRVDADGPWLVDVGFGRHSHFPLRLDTGAEQVDPDGGLPGRRAA